MFMCVSESRRGRLTGKESWRFNRGETGVVSETLSRPVLCSVFYFKLFISLLYDNLALTMSTAECSQCDD